MKKDTALLDFLQYVLFLMLILYVFILKISLAKGRVRRYIPYFKFWFRTSGGFSPFGMGGMGGMSGMGGRRRQQRRRGEDTVHQLRF